MMALLSLSLLVVSEVFPGPFQVSERLFGSFVRGQIAAIR